MARAKKLLLFDVDGTLTAPRLMVTPEMEAFLYNEAKPVATLGLVGGSDIAKISEQMRGRDVVSKFDYFFSENGLVAYKQGQLVAEQSILKKFGDKVLQNLINFRSVTEKHFHSDCEECKINFNFSSA